MWVRPAVRPITAFKFAKITSLIKNIKVLDILKKIKEQWSKNCSDGNVKCVKIIKKNKEEFNEKPN